MMMMMMMMYLCVGISYQLTCIGWPINGPVGVLGRRRQAIVLKSQAVMLLALLLCSTLSLLSRL
ncbi:unnamed protein product, partial [Musa banksii]